MFRLLNPRPQLSAFTTHQVKHLRNRLAKVARGNVWFWKKNADSLVWGSCSLNSRLEPSWTQQVCKLAPIHIRNTWILCYFLGLKTGCKGLATDLELCGHDYKYTISVTVTLLCQWGGPHPFPLLPPVLFFRETLALPTNVTQADPKPMHRKFSHVNKHSTKRRHQNIVTAFHHRNMLVFTSAKCLSSDIWMSPTYTNLGVYCGKCSNMFNTVFFFELMIRFLEWMGFKNVYICKTFDTLYNLLWRKSCLNYIPHYCESQEYVFHLDK